MKPNNNTSNTSSKIITDYLAKENQKIRQQIKQLEDEIPRIEKEYLTLKKTMTTPQQQIELNKRTKHKYVTAYNKIKHFKKSIEINKNKIDQQQQTL